MFQVTNPLGVNTPAKEITPCSIESATNAFIRDGVLVPAPAAEVAKISQNERAFFCLVYGIYSLPTIELVEFIDSLIPDKSKAIEIGSGNGVYARSLGIRGTDNYMQHPKNRGKFRNCLDAFEKMGQPPVSYGDDVEEIDGRDAVRKYKAETVVASWVTHKFNPTKPHLDGNMFGVDFNWILDRKHVKRLILIGNEFTHKNNPIMERPHQMFELDYQYSRSQYDSLDRVYVWDV